MRLRSALLGLCLLPALRAQDPGPVTRRPSLGFHLANLDGNPAVGLEATSSYLGHGSLAFRVSADRAAHRGLPAAGPAEEQMGQFGLVRAGVVGVGGVVAGCIRLYGEGGVFAAFPSAGLSSQGTQWGGYGHFGFECLFGRPAHAPCAYFIELGTVGSGARAERMLGRPTYLNGFVTRVGFRLFL
jgi:hypothetical protein